MTSVEVWSAWPSYNWTFFLALFSMKLYYLNVIKRLMESLIHNFACHSNTFCRNTSSGGQVEVVGRWKLKWYKCMVLYTSTIYISKVIFVCNQLLWWKDEGFNTHHLVSFYRCIAREHRQTFFWIKNLKIHSSYYMHNTGFWTFYLQKRKKSPYCFNLEISKCLWPGVAFRKMSSAF